MCILVGRIQKQNVCFGAALLQVLILFLCSQAVVAQNEGWHRVSSQPTKALDGNVEALFDWDDGTGPALIAGGDFVTAGWQSAAAVARWDGVAWTPLQSGLTGVVRAFAAYQGELIATGDFTLAGSPDVKNIARWNGSQWRPLGTGLSGRGRALLVANGKLYVGGEFMNAGGQLVNRIAQWDGVDWEPMANGFSSPVRALHLFGGEVYAGLLSEGVARWNGSAWVALPTLNGSVFAMTTFDNELIAGGSFSGVFNSASVARWTGTAWAGPNAGIPSAEIRVLRAYGSALMAGGRFELGSNFGRNVAIWNGANWVAIAAAPEDGLGGPSAAETSVNAIVLRGQTLLVGGQFRTAGSIGTTSIAQWNQGWSNFASGIADSVETVGVHDGRLIAGGTFTSIPGSSNGQRVGAWDGFSWSSFGLGVNGRNALSVLDTTTYRGELVVAGSFFFPVGATSANGITRWNGNSWRTLGQGANNIQALSVFGLDLVAAGDFSMAGAVNANGWALWDGNDWRHRNGDNKARRVDFSRWI